MATRMNLNVDLQRGVVPISKAASSLAALRTGATGQPVIVTQKGYPTGVLLSIELFSALKGMADDQGEDLSLPELTASEVIVDAQVEEPAMPAVTEEVAPEVSTVEPQRPAPRRRKAAKAEVVA